MKKTVTCRGPCFMCYGRNWQHAMLEEAGAFRPGDPTGAVSTGYLRVSHGYYISVEDDSVLQLFCNSREYLTKQSTPV